jgi:hypothetical protein
MVVGDSRVGDYGVLDRTMSMPMTVCVMSVVMMRFA